MGIAHLFFKRFLHCELPDLTKIHGKSGILQ
jgi:hypothetical protein